GDQLSALERAEPITWGAGVEGRQLGPDGVQRPDGAAVVVLVVADDHPLGDAVQCPRPDGNRGDLLVHGRCPLCRASTTRRVVRSPEAVTSKARWYRSAVIMVRCRRRQPRDA